MENQEQQMQAMIQGLKVRCFDAEEAAKHHAEMAQQIVNGVCQIAGIEGIENLEQFFEALKEKFPQEEVEAAE